MAIYRPRMAAVLHVPVAGSPEEREAQNAGDGPSITLPVRVKAAELEINDHNRADELRLTLNWHSVGLDPRLVRNATVDFYLGEADDDGHWEPSRRDLRFCGAVFNPQRHSGEDEPYELDLKSLDYTDFFLRAKPFGSSGIPDMTQTLDDAWRRIVSQTPGAGVLADRLLWIGDAPDRVQELRDVLNGKQRKLQNAPFPKLGDAVSERFRKLARVATKPDTDAWAVWQQCVGMLGLISWIDRDWCVVSTATNYYTETDPPVFAWGLNVAKLSEGSEAFFRKGILLTAFDPIRGRAIEARYPEKSPRTAVEKRRVKAHKGGDEADVLKEAEWEAFAVQGTNNPEILLVQARRVYEERSRQELQGTLITKKMRVDTASGKSFDVLDLRQGDDIKILFNANERDALLALPDLWSRVFYLQDRGYGSDVALILAKNIDSLAMYSSTFHVRRILHRFQIEEDSGTYETEITYTNRITTRGDRIG